MKLTRATRAVYAVFILSGFGFASWASRIPQVRDNLELSPRQLGLLLLAMAVGSVISMPLAGVVVLERADSVGASWQGRYDSLRLHTARWLSGLPGAPIPRQYGRWVARDDFVAYLRERV